VKRACRESSVRCREATQIVARSQRLTLLLRAEAQAVADLAPNLVIPSSQLLEVDNSRVAERCQILISLANGLINIETNDSLHAELQS
jgi:hypothetical protein